MLLTKARLSALVVVTTAAGYWLHCLLVDWPGALPWRLVHTIAGTALTAFGASVFNQLMEMDADARMQRTADRPLASRRLQPEVAFVIGALLAGAGIIHLGVKVNTEAAALAGLTLLVYLFVYTPMKRKSVWNTIVGAVSGAMNTAGQLGSFVSAVAFGYLVEGLGSYDLALMPLAGMLLVGGAAFAMIDPRRALAV
jgi:heme O synthase-like polyprenyltransferase